MATQNLTKISPKSKIRLGDKFERLIVIGYAGKDKRKNTFALCRCRCGKVCKISSRNLLSGQTKSCGCLARENARTLFLKHGMSKTQTYGSWHAMIQRCENPKNQAYKNYGGRGIRVCDNWHKFENFYKDMGDRPEGKSLDRWPDNDENYKPGNCRWATSKEQRTNSRPISFGPRKQKWFIGCSPTGKLVIENSQNRLAQTFNLDCSHISKCLLGKLEHHKGWTFKLV